MRADDNASCSLTDELYLTLEGVQGRIAQSVTCLTADTCVTADPGVASLIPVRSNTFMAILLPFANSRRVVVSYKHVHEVLVNRLVKLSLEKSVVYN